MAQRTSERMLATGLLSKCSFLSSSFLLKGSRRESVKCDRALIILSGAFMYFLHAVGGGRMEERWGKRMKPGSLSNTALHFQCSCESCPSSQNSDGTGHALFMDSNCYRTSKRAPRQARDVAGTL